MTITVWLQLADSGNIFSAMSRKEFQVGNVRELNDFTRGQLDAALMKIGHDSRMGTAAAITAFLAGKLIVTTPLPQGLKWREQDGVIYFSITSDGTTGEEWITRLKKKGFLIGDYAKSVLRSKDFKPTSGMTTEIAVLKSMLFEDNDRITKKIRAFAAERKLEAPNAEVACLIREMFTDKEIEAMGLWWIVAMHEPIRDSDGDLHLLSTDCGFDGRWLDSYYGKPGFRWDRDVGFAFAVSQTVAKAA